MFNGACRWSRTLGVWAMLAVFAPPAAAADILRAIPPVQLTIGPHGEPVADVLINGRGPFRFVIDTGSSHSSVTDRLAETLMLPVVAKTVVNTSTGPILSAVVRVASLSVGELQTPDLLPSVVAWKALDPRGVLDGVVGQDVLAERRYTIDFAGRHLLWDEAATGTAHGVWLPIRFESGRFVADVPQGTTTLRLVPDSGAEGLVLYGNVDGLDMTPDYRTSAIRVDTLAGRRSARQVLVRQLRVGPDLLRDVPAAIIERGLSTDWTSDGLLPLRYFRRVTVDGPARRLQVER